MVPFSQTKRGYAYAQPCDTIVLSNGLSIPAVGFGTYKTGDGDSAVLSNAIAQGYRHFDTASFYGTETALGQAVAESDIPREDFFLTSKLWKTEMGYDAALRAFDATLERLGTDYLDLYLIHWPRPDLELEDWAKLDRETWRALERLYESGLVRAIGVSNFLPHHLEPILASANVAPMVDQLEFHPGYTQDEAVAFCQNHSILVEAWSPLGRNRLTGNGVLTRLAAEHGVSPPKSVCALPFSGVCSPAQVLQPGTDGGEPGPVLLLPDRGGDGSAEHHAPDRLVR